MIIVNYRFFPYCSNPSNCQLVNLRVLTALGGCGFPMCCPTNRQIANPPIPGSAVLGVETYQDFSNRCQSSPDSGKKYPWITVVLQGAKPTNYQFTNPRLVAILGGYNVSGFPELIPVTSKWRYTTTTVDFNAFPTCQPYKPPICQPPECW